MNGPAVENNLHHSAAHFHRPPKLTERLFRSLAARYMRDIQAFHMDSRGWADFGYSFMVFKSLFGRLWVFEGRGWGIVGAHTYGRNSVSHGFCVAGNFQTERAGRRLKEAIARLHAHSILHAHNKPGSKLKRHQDHAATACPGTNLAAVTAEINTDARRIVEREQAAA